MGGPLKIKNICFDSFLCTVSRNQKRNLRNLFHAFEQRERPLRPIFERSQWFDFFVKTMNVKRRCFRSGNMYQKMLWNPYKFNPNKYLVGILTKYTDLPCGQALELVEGGFDSWPGRSGAGRLRPGFFWRPGGLLELRCFIQYFLEKKYKKNWKKKYNNI